jgi:hypothetical protein
MSLFPYQICVLQGTTAYTFLTTTTDYPGIRVKVNQSLSSNQGDKLLHSVATGECTGAIINYVDWTFYMNQQAINSKCNLVMVENIQTFSGAFPYLVDFSKKCTSFVETVISTILVGMKADGSLDDILSKHCPRSTEHVWSADDLRLRLCPRVIGLFI